MTERRLRAILDRVATVSVGIIGDFCLDAYWDLDTSTPETSIETGKPTQAVRRQRYHLGGAGNIAANAIALHARATHAFGVIGDDLFGREMTRLCAQQSIATEGLLQQTDHFDTPVYAKPYVGDVEQNRLDFGRFNSFSEDSIHELMRIVREALPALNVLIVNQQLANGVCSEHMLQWLDELALEHPGTLMIADSRHRPHVIRHMIRKLNTTEASAGHPGVSLKARVAEIAAVTNRPVFVTRGSEGIMACEGTSVYEVPGIPLSGENDPVGAGDTTVAAIACALAAGASVPEAAELGNLAAAVTVQKLRQTGAASPEEILSLFSAGVQQP